LWTYQGEPFTSARYRRLRRVRLHNPRPAHQPGLHRQKDVLWFTKILPPLRGHTRKRKKWSFLTTGDLTEVGDFVAGVFSPLALICLFFYLDVKKSSLHVDPVKGGGPPMEEHCLAVRNHAMSQKSGLVASISETSLKEVMWDLMRVSDE